MSSQGCQLIYLIPRNIGSHRRIFLTPASALVSTHKLFLAHLPIGPPLSDASHNFPQSRYSSASPPVLSVARKHDTRYSPDDHLFREMPQRTPLDYNYSAMSLIHLSLNSPPSVDTSQYTLVALRAKLFRSKGHYVLLEPTILKLRTFRHSFSNEYISEHSLILVVKHIYTALTPS